MASQLRTAAASSAAASDSDDTGRQADPVDVPDFGSAEGAILDGEIGGFPSSSSSSSARRFSVLTDMTCSRAGSDTNRMPLAGLPIGGIIPAVLPPPPIEEQNSLVMALRETADKLKSGQSRFVVAKRWMRRWEGYVGWNTFDWSAPAKPILTDPPGPITNEDILEADGTTLREYQDQRVECVDGRMWELLSGWYGGNPIKRLVIEDNGRPTVELYQLQLKLTRKGGSSVDMTLSKSCTVGDLRREGISALQIGTPDECEGLQLHVMTSKTFKLRELDDDGKTLSDFFSLNSAWVQFELPGDIDGNEGGDNDSYSFCTWGGSNSFSRPSATPGAVGVHNLGNTCFMNAAIQCLIHIPQVVNYFGEKDGRQPFLDDLNVENPLGTKGELAMAFGDLVKCVWEGKESCIYPRDFRDVLCDHAQQFVGYEQHDSQEFLAYLVDGIHEDVNRVREKPFVEKVEAISGECDDTAAHRSWDAHLQRNDSFVVDTMHGQYKSVVTCPVEGCQKTSTTFDPAMYLSVPLPVTAEKSVELILATLDGSRPKRYAVWMPKMAKVKNLRQRLAKATGKREDRLAFTLVWLHKIHDVFEDDHSISDIRLDELVAFELLEWPQPPPLPTDDYDCSRECTACGRELDCKTRGEVLGGRGWEQKLAPFLLRTCREKELRSGSDADGRSRLFRDAKSYLAGFPSAQELADLTSKQEAKGNGNGNGELGVEMQHRLRQASNHSSPFTELTSLEEVADFFEAVQSLKELVLYEQRDVNVQIIQHRSSECDRYTYSTCYGRTTTPFCFPLLISYLPHSTTVGEFREMLATVLRRFVLPPDAARKNEDTGMDIDPSVEEGAIPSTADGDHLSSPQDESSGHGIEHVVQLFRSGELELLSEGLKGHDVNILGGRGDRDDDLVANWIDESASGMSSLILRWSEGALREAFDASEIHKVEDDASVAACRNRLPQTLSLSQCVDCFLEREQLDESEMWYCSSCKVHRRAFKLMHLWRLPPVLVVHLKRFSYDTFGGWAASREKIESFVSFPVRGLDMQHLERVSQARSVGDLKGEGNADAPTTGGSGLASPASIGQDWVMADQQKQEQPGPNATEEPAVTTDEGGQQQQQQQTTTSPTPAVYDLWGVVNHYGGLGGGHYTANALNMIDNRWREYSDDRVSVVENEADLVTSAAYVLFYSRRGISSKNGRSGKGATGSPEGGASNTGGENSEP